MKNNFVLACIILLTSYTVAFSQTYDVKIKIYADANSKYSISQEEKMIGKFAYLDEEKKIIKSFEDTELEEKRYIYTILEGKPQEGYSFYKSNR